MRTKHILTALALPALFAACTADEFESVNVNNGGAQMRPTVGENFTLSTGNADTRYAAEESGSGISLNFTQGDQLGAAIIDNYDPKAESPYDFEVINSLAGNNPFEFQGGDEWTSNTTLGIGHYLFKFPYNEGDNNRAAATFELPTVQKLYTDENGDLDLTAAIEAGNMAIAATVLTEGQTAADVSLKNLFTYPKVQINFDNGEKVNTVSQVVLEYDDAITVKGGFDHKVVANLFADAPKGLTGKDYWDDEKESVIWDEVETADFLLGESGDGAAYNPYPKNERTSKYIVVKFPKNTQVKLDSNTKNKYVEARFMMPSVDEFIELEGNDKNKKLGITMFIYTDNGIYSTPFEYNSFIFKSTTTDETINGALGRGKGYNLTLDKASLNKDNADNIVTTVEDWNALVRDFGASTNPVDVAIVGNEFAFDSETIFPSKSTFTVKTNLNVDGDVEISNVDMNDNTITVLEGATLTVNETLADANIVNEGTVEVVAGVDEDENPYKGVTSIENKANLNVAEGADAVFALENVKGAKVTVAKGGKMTVSGYNNGKININGIVWTTTDFENKDVEKKNGVIVNTPTINVNAGAQLVANKGTLTNNGLIVNEGEFTCESNEGTIVNKYELQSKAGAVSYITENNGKVVVEEANPITLTINSNDKGIVEYTTSKDSEDFTGSDVNTVIATGSYEVKGGSLSSLTLKGTGTLKVSTVASIGTLNVNGSTTLGEKVALSVAELNIAEGAMLNIPKGTELTVSTSDYENEGRILVGGTLNAIKVSQANKGNVNNDGGQITWKEGADAVAALETAKTEYHNAMVAAITEFASNSIEGTWTVNKLSYDILNGKNGKLSAAQQFEGYVAANSGKNEFKALKEKFDAYKALDNNITLISGYAAAAKEVVENNETAVENLTLAWTCKNYSSDEEAHIYGTEADAMTAFKKAVADGEVVVSETLHKVIICSSETNFIPDGSYALTTDPIYVMFDYIEQCSDWKTEFGFTETYKVGTTEAGNWDMTMVRQWIADVRQTTNSSLLVQEAVEFVSENDLWNESKNWNYQKKIIQRIAYTR